MANYSLSLAADDMNRITLALKVAISQRLKSNEQLTSLGKEPVLVPIRIWLTHDGQIQTYKRKFAIQLAEYNFRKGKWYDVHPFIEKDMRVLSVLNDFVVNGEDKL